MNNKTILITYLGLSAVGAGVIASLGGRPHQVAAYLLFMVGMTSIAMGINNIQ